MRRKVAFDSKFLFIYSIESWNNEVFLSQEGIRDRFNAKEDCGDSIHYSDLCRGFLSYFAKFLLRAIIFHFYGILDPTTKAKLR